MDVDVDGFDWIWIYMMDVWGDVWGDGMYIARPTSHVS